MSYSASTLLNRGYARYIATSQAAVTISYFVRSDGITNIEAMVKTGKVSVGYDGNTVNIIHHFDQKYHGVLVVIPETYKDMVNKFGTLSVMGSEFLGDPDNPRFTLMHRVDDTFPVKLLDGKMLLFKRIAQS